MLCPLVFLRLVSLWISAYYQGVSPIGCCDSLLFYFPFYLERGKVMYDVV